MAASTAMVHRCVRGLTAAWQAALAFDRLYAARATSSQNALAAAASPYPASGEPLRKHLVCRRSFRGKVTVSI
jgi:hypothetical protein